MTHQQTRTMTGGAAAIAQLVAEGVEIILGIPGAHNIDLCDAVCDHAPLSFVGGRHEQSMTFMANGYARASGKIAVPLVVSGPGVTNSLTALADAYLDSVPMVLLAAAPSRDALGKGAFHELKDQTAALASVTKWNTYVTRAEAVPEAIHTAFTEAYQGRPGPVAVEIPIDVQAQRAQVEIVPPLSGPPCGAVLEAVRQAARLLADAASPMVLVGGGAARSRTAEELIRLIERIATPCFSTSLGKGTVPTDHPLSLGCNVVKNGPGRVLLEEADLLLVVGSSLDEADTAQWTLPLPENLIQIDSCAEVIGRNYPVTVGLVGDAGVVLGQLLQELSTLETPVRPSPASRIAQIKAQITAKLQREPVWEFVAAMQRALPVDAIVTNDAAAANGWIVTCLDRWLPRTLSITSNLAALGYAFPAALGAKLAYADRQAVAVVGDGGFLFTSDALATAVQYSLNAVVVLFNNNCYGTIRQMQTCQFGRAIGVDLVNPDFVKLAEAYGAAAQRAATPDQLHDAMRDAFERDVPTVIEVPLETDLPVLS